MKFNNYRDSLVENFEEINEAAFSMKNLKKVSDLLAKIASKKLGTDFQPAWADDFKKAGGSIGIGFRYMSMSGQQIRFNNLKKSENTFTVNSVDYWKKGSGFTEPSLTIEFAKGINIVQLKNQLFDAIKSGKAPKISYSDLAEAMDLFETDLDEGSAAADKRAKRKAFGNKHGIDVSQTDDNAYMKREAGKKGLDTEYTNWMNIKKNVSEKTKFDQEIREDEKQLGPSGIFADPKYVFDDMEEAAKTVARGHWRSAIFAGMGGIGKTYGVKQVLTSELGPYGEGTDSKWAFYEGLKTTAFGLYKILLLNKRKLIVFDDSDSIWGNGDIVNMMKIVTSDSGDRSISWGSNSVANVSLMNKAEREQYEFDYLTDVMEDPNTLMKPPSTFNFEGQMINISNLKADKFDPAIKSRAIFINVYLAERDVLRRMATIKKLQGASDEKIKLLLTALVPDAMDALVGKGRYGGEVKYVTPEEARANKTLNMRSMDITEALMDSGAKDWARMAALYA